MAPRKKCLAGHDPHPDCKLVCCMITPERLLEVRLDAWTARNWASEVSYGAACTCGMKPEAGHSNVFGSPVERGVCYRHGTAQAEDPAQDR